MNKPKISQLQKDLESEGWKFLTNVDPSKEYFHIFGENIPFNHHPKKSNEEIRRKYFERGFSEVLVTEAYDTKGKPIKDYRAIYTKKD